MNICTDTATTDAQCNAIIRDIVQDWNSFAAEYADLAQTQGAKDEFGLRVQAAQIKLLEIVSSRKDRLNAFIDTFKQTNWIEAVQISVTRVVADLLRTEARRLVGEVQLLVDASKIANGQPIPPHPVPVPEFQLPALSAPNWFEAAAASVEAAMAAVGQAEPGSDQVKSAFNQRVVAISRWASKWAEELKVGSDSLIQIIGNWTAARIESEISAVEAVGIFLREKIDKAKPLTSELKIAGTKLSFEN